MSVSRKELIREMCRAIRENNAAVFGGAGLSRPSGYVDWKGFLRPLAADIHLDVDREHDLLAVAQYYRNQRCGGTMNQKIMDAFNTDTEINENVSILTRLPISTYWTTNYDSLIEEGLRQANRNPDVKSEQDQLAVSKRDRDAIVYKMHGDAAKPAHAVLTKDDYETYGKDRQLFRTALQGDLISKTFLFVGFSFEDPNLDYILGQIRSLLGENIHYHYCFLRRVQQSDYDGDNASYDYDRAKQDYREEDLRRYGIQVCFVDSYDEVTDILRELEAAVRNRNIFISGSAEEYGPMWTEEKAEELAGKLAAAIAQDGCRVVSGFGLGIGSAVINSVLGVVYQTRYGHVDEYLRMHPFPQNIHDPEEKKRKFTEYREGMLEDVGIAIFLFGNKVVKDPASGKEAIVNADGCRQEFEIAKEKGKILIPIGSTGYAAKEFFDEMKADAARYPYLEGHWDTLENETDEDRLVGEVMEIVKGQQIP